MILINLQKRKTDGKLFLSFLSCKNRYKETDLKFFNQPFDEIKFNLVDDIMNDTPAGLISLATDFEDVDAELYSKSRGRKVHTSKTEINVVDDTDLFNISPLS